MSKDRQEWAKKVGAGSSDMSIFCAVGRHKHSVVSIARDKVGEYIALREACGVSLTRDSKGKLACEGPVTADAASREPS